MTRPPEVIAASGEVRPVAAFFTRKLMGEEREFCEKPFTTDWTPLYYAAPKTALQPFADEVEASGETEPTRDDNELAADFEHRLRAWHKERADDELTLIETAISHLQQARSALNREQPETATGRGYVQDARAALAKVQS